MPIKTFGSEVFSPDREHLRIAWSIIGFPGVSFAGGAPTPVVRHVIEPRASCAPHD
jgi:hypothetical protein